MKHVSPCNDQCDGGWQPSILKWKKLNNDVIFLDTINMINVKLCMMVVLIELYPFIPILVTLTVCISRSQCGQTVLTENFMFLSDHLDTL